MFLTQSCSASGPVSDENQDEPRMNTNGHKFGKRARAPGGDASLKTAVLAVDSDDTPDTGEDARFQSELRSMTQFTDPLNGMKNYPCRPLWYPASDPEQKHQNRCATTVATRRNLL